MFESRSTAEAYSSLYTRSKNSPYTLLGAAVVLLGLVIWAVGGAYSPPPVQIYHHGFSGKSVFVGPLANRLPVPCRDAAGDYLPYLGGPDLGEVTFDGSTPQPYAGSYDELHLQQTWLTAEQRYGPYGKGQSDAGYNYTKVDWSKIDWAELQNACFMRNQERFTDLHNAELHGSKTSTPVLPTINPIHKLARPSIKDQPILHKFSRIPSRQKKSRGSRTAIVLRAWSAFNWVEENLWVLRSLITEAALATGGEYVVYILMDVKSEFTRMYPDFFSNAGYYDHLLDVLVPTEFRNITVLYDRDFLRTWYPRVGEYRPELQMFQPLQIFAQSFPQYDYYVEMEMDVRFTGHAGHLFQAFADFARREPRKQARQRMSYFFMQSVFNNYSDFMHQIDKKLDGGDAYYHGVAIPDIIARFGPESPYSDPNEDHFDWGVGEEADFFTFSPCNNVTIHKKWVYYWWQSNLEYGLQTPRVVCPITVSRSSWNLLNAVHNAQLEQGLGVPSEATMMSFALWHGAKVSLPPLPIYSRRDHDFSAETINLFVNGGLPSVEHNGMAWGEWVYEPDDQMFRQNTSLHGGLEPTYRYQSPYPPDLWKAWMNGVEPDYEPDQLPTIVYRDGKTYLPNTMFHPVKTNKGPKNNEPPKWLRAFGIEEW